MLTASSSQQSNPRDVAQEVVALLHRLGLTALVRDPESAVVLAAGPGAESAFLSAPPGSVSIATARVGGHTLRTEVLRNSGLGPGDLTERQRTVAALLSAGLRNREIGERLRISTHTVRRHVEEILRRLNVPNRAAAATVLQRGRRGSDI